MRITATDPGRIPPVTGPDGQERRRPIPYSPPGRSPAALAAVDAMNAAAHRADQARRRHGPGGWPR